MTIPPRTSRTSTCLSRGCANPAEYDVKTLGVWWWSECSEHTAVMRSRLGKYVTAVETHDPGRDAFMAPRDLPGDRPKLRIEVIEEGCQVLRSRDPDGEVTTTLTISYSEEQAQAQHDPYVALHTMGGPVYVSTGPIDEQDLP